MTSPGDGAEAIRVSFEPRMNAVNANSINGLKTRKANEKMPVTPVDVTEAVLSSMSLFGLPEGNFRGSQRKDLQQN